MWNSWTTVPRFYHIDYLIKYGKNKSFSLTNDLSKRFFFE